MALENNLCYVFGLLDYLRSDYRYLLSQKPLNNGLISKKFIVPMIHMHLVVLNVGMTSKKNCYSKIFLISAPSSPSGSDTWVRQFGSTAMPRNRSSLLSVFLGGDQVTGLDRLTGILAPTHSRHDAPFFPLTAILGQPGWHTLQWQPSQKGA